MFKLIALYTLVVGVWMTSSCAVAQEVRLDQIQDIGTHNSYRAGLELMVQGFLQRQKPDLARLLEYQHPSLPAQFDAGIRQIELDIYADSQGGRFAHPSVNKWLRFFHFPEITIYDQEVMKQPGFKVMHIQDIDQHATCEPFTNCLSVIKKWSQEHPDHSPIFIILEVEQENPTPFSTPYEAVSEVGYDALDKEILSVFDRHNLITPDDLRGDFPTIREAVLKRGWPTVSTARGKIIFLLDQRSNGPVYMQHHSGLRGRVAFTNADPHDDDAAFTELNDGPPDAIRDLVKQHFLVRTRADVNTEEARNNSPRRMEEALASGAQLVSTDYPVSEPARWTGYYVGFPSGTEVRCNPVTAPQNCQDASIEAQTKVERAVLVVRHGIRYPLEQQAALEHDFSRSFMSGAFSSYGDLTPHGRDMEELDGRFLHKDLVEAGLLPDRPCLDGGYIALRANSAPRTIASAEALAKGLSPACVINTVHKKAGDRDSFFEPNPVANGAALSLKITPEDGRNYKKDRIFLGAFLGCGQQCDRLSAPSFYTGATMDGVKGGLDVSGNLAELLMLSYMDNESSQYVRHIEEVPEDFQKLSYIHAEMLKYMTLHAYKNNSQYLADAIFKDLFANDPHKVNIYMAHDDTIVSLLDRMGASVHATGFGENDIPPGAILAFLVMKPPQGAEFVRVAFIARTPQSLRTGQGHPYKVILMPHICKNITCSRAELEANFTH